VTAVDVLIVVFGAVLVVSTAACTAIAVWILLRLALEAIDEARDVGLSLGWLLVLPVLSAVTFLAVVVTGQVVAGVDGLW
jgi:hypothetical protein